MVRFAFMIAMMLAWTVSAQGQNGQPGGPVAPTTEKGQAVAPTGAPQPTLPPGAQASVPTGSAEANGPGSAGTSSNPLAQPPGGPAPDPAKNGVNPANGVYSTTEDKGKR